MATTTPNFGWDIPQSTDLVKDGATAIAALGNDIDTSMVDLKGGTTGQVLSKASNTDMDFTWVAPTAGDIEGVTAGTGLTGGGTSGTVTLSLDQANYGGGQYAAGKNKIINGDFSVNQRNFSSTTSVGFGFDRWAYDAAGGTVTYSAQTFTAGTAPVTGYESKNFARLVTASQSATSNYAYLYQRIEDVRVLANQTAVISFWAKANTGTPKIAVEIEQVFGTGGSPSTRVRTYFGQATLSTSWARYTLTTTIPSISGKTLGTNNDSYLEVNLFTSAGSDFNSRTGSLGLQNFTADIWGVQVEAGSTGTPFQTATGTIQGELAACQRYYEKRLAGGANYGFGINSGCTSTTRAYLNVTYGAPKRTNPSISFGGSLGLYNSTVAQSVTSFGGVYGSGISGVGYPSGSMDCDVASGLTANQVIWLRDSGSGTGYIEFSSEL